ncbi:leucyl aminopeptidase family protein [Mycoplasmopsis ciconiae]|uniref:Probable cytosol aminopeptidase n=2 Tax=Mycoplasmopsis ciconiae TaxID=561067 RepID=A0ABU7MKS0_9BACT|nr:leucyl aminopeptidase family protein [Mycoplasmopsis ciconiae]
MKIQLSQKSNYTQLKAVYFDSNLPKILNKKQGALTELFEENVTYFYIDEKHSNYDGLFESIDTLASKHNRDWSIDVQSFVRQNINLEEVLRLLVSRIVYSKAKLFQLHYKQANQENNEEEKENKLELFLADFDSKTANFVEELNIIAKAVNDTRNLQIMPENYCNSEMLAEKIVDDFKNIPNLKVNVLTKAQIREMGMNLLLSVNKGSTHEPRVVVIELNNKPDSKEKIAFVGKGITFDTGGVNTKGYHMEGMKFDMSGSVICAYALKTLALIDAKVNAVAVMMITDNRLDGDASLPENVYQSLSGKYVEVTDTDAEGRLVLADGLFYASKFLNSTLLVDVATLTGSLSYALGNVYTGVWSTKDDHFETFSKSAKKAGEKVWRMPMHKEFNKGNTSSKVADLLNYSSSSGSDSNAAAMFLNEFTNNTDYIHCDVAFTADKKGEPTGCLVATLVEFAKNYDYNKNNETKQNEGKTC